MKNEDLLKQVRDLSNIKNLEKMSGEDTKNILRLVEENILQEAHIKALVECYPAFISASIEGLKAISIAAEAAKESQIEVTKEIGNLARGLVGVLETLSNNAATDETREKLAHYVIEAIKLQIEFARILSETNKDNNQLWRDIAKAAGAVVLISAGIFGGISYAKDKKE